MTAHQPALLSVLRRLGMVAAACLCAAVAMGQPAPRAIPAKPAQPPSKEAPSETPATSIMVLHLRYAEAGAMVKLVAPLIGRDTQFAADARANAIVVQGSDNSLRKIQELVKMFDVPVPPRKGARPGALTFRLIWLVDASTSTGKEVPELARDYVADIARELNTLGMGDVRQVAQAVVKTRDDGKFKLSCSPNYEGPAMSELTASGTVRLTPDAGDKVDLKVQITVASSSASPSPPGRPPAGQKLIDLDLETDVALSAYTVVATAPVGKVTSIFVIQVIPGKP